MARRGEKQFLKLLLLKFSTLFFVCVRERFTAILAHHNISPSIRARDRVKEGEEKKGLHTPDCDRPRLIAQ
jgi:hypothetical protein